MFVRLELAHEEGPPLSAICGVVGIDGRPWSAVDLDGVVGALAPLGPDGGGAWSGSVGRCGVAVAAALRHNTPEDAADVQPAESRDGSLVLVGDLRVDNRDELAGLLGLSDGPAVPDSAFVLAAYERWGEAMLERVVGDFALAIVDRRRGRVLIARDHVGARPLVLHERPGRVVFASNPLALTGFECVGHELDVGHAAEQLAVAFGSGRTFVEGVRWLAPGNARWIDASGGRSWTWWKADPHDIVDLGSSEAHEEELRQAFDRAVAARLRSVGGVGAALSGGLDSTSVAATAAGLLAPTPLRTYTSAPRPGWSGSPRANRDADESPLVRMLAERYPNIDPTFVHADPGVRLFDIHEPLWERGSGPLLDVTNMVWFHALLLRGAADGVTTMLTGTQGNLAFSADGPGWLSSLLRKGRVAAALREGMAWTRVTGEGRLRAARDHVVYPLLPVRARTLYRAMRRRRSRVEDWIASVPLRPEVAAELDLPGLIPALDESRRADRRATDWATLMGTAFRAANLPALDAVTNVEQRDPTADRRVIETAIRQPEWVRRRGGVIRAAVRGAMADRLPAEIVHRTRRGDQLPDWFDVVTASRVELAGELEELEDHPTSRELIDVERLRRIFAGWLEPGASGDEDVIRDFRVVLVRSLLFSRYLRWFERRARNRG